jgi:hypothetical protein
MAGLTAETTTAQTNKEALNDNLSTLIKNIQDQPNQVADITANEGLTAKNTLRLKTQNEITALDKTYRDEVNSIKENPQGKFGGAIQQDINQATDRYNNNRANLAIVYNSQLGDYQAALDTVNLKVNALKDTNSQSLQAYQLMANAVNNDLTDSEKIQVQANIQEKQDKAKAIQDAYASALETAVKNNAPSYILSAIDSAAKDPKATQASIYSAMGTYGGTSGGVAGTAGTIANDNLQAYASQYASTGTLPSASDMKFSNLTAGQITSYAKQLPKTTGQVVNAITGVNDSKTPATEQADYARLNNIIKNSERLLQLDKERIGGIVSGTLGKVFGSEKQAEYMATRKAIVDDMSRMQSGAALTENEIKQYEDYLPGRFSNTLGLGVSSEKKIDNFKTLMSNRLNERLNTNGLSMYGYTKVKVGGEDRTVGEVIDIGGTQYKVLPDGTLTDII